MIQWEPGMSLDDVVREAFQQALKYHQNNKTATAKALGISRNTVDNKLDEWKAKDENRLKFEAAEKKARDDFGKSSMHPDAVPIGSPPRAQGTNGKKPLATKKK